MFPKIQDVPLVVRKALLEPQEVKRRLGIYEHDKRKVILIALRITAEMSTQAIHELIASNEFIIVSPMQLDINISGSTFHVDEQLSASHFPSLVKACDVVVSKLGYGIVSECISGRTPIIFTERDDFAEFELIESNLSPFLPHKKISKAEFLHGSWHNAVKAVVFAHHDWTYTFTNGADRVARILQNYS